MPANTAVIDDSVSCSRYLAVSPQDRQWGLFVTGVGHEVLRLDEAAGGSSGPYRFEWQTASDGKFIFAPNFPEPYRYDWNKGRTLVDDYWLLYVNAGAEWRFETEAVSGPLSVPPGNVMLLFPEMWHRYRPLLSEAADFSSTLWVHFGGDIARSWQKRGLFTPKKPLLHVGSNPAIESIFHRLYHHVQTDQSPCLQNSLSGCAMELLRSAETAARVLKTPNVSLDVIHQAKGIFENLSIPSPSPRRVAQLLNSPYDQFRHSFKLATGMSPYQYRMQVVIRRAKELLDGTDLSMKQISSALRFSDQLYFAKVFRSKTGTTPTEWRARVRRGR